MSSAHVLHDRRDPNGMIPLLAERRPVSTGAYERGLPPLQHAYSMPVTHIAAPQPAPQAAMPFVRSTQDALCIHSGWLSPRLEGRFLSSVWEKRYGKVLCTSSPRVLALLLFEDDTATELRCHLEVDLDDADFDVSTGMSRKSHRFEVKARLPGEPQSSAHRFEFAVASRKDVRAWRAVFEQSHHGPAAFGAGIEYGRPRQQSLGSSSISSSSADGLSSYDGHSSEGYGATPNMAGRQMYGSGAQTPYMKQQSSSLSPTNRSTNSSSSGVYSNSSLSGSLSEFAPTAPLASSQPQATSSAFRAPQPWTPTTNSTLPASSSLRMAIGPNNNAPSVFRSMESPSHEVADAGSLRADDNQQVRVHMTPGQVAMPSAFAMHSPVTAEVVQMPPTSANAPSRSAKLVTIQSRQAPPPPPPAQPAPAPPATTPEAFSAEQLQLMRALMASFSNAQISPEAALAAVAASTPAAPAPAPVQAPVVETEPVDALSIDGDSDEEEEEVDASVDAHAEVAAAAVEPEPTPMLESKPSLHCCSLPEHELMECVFRTDKAPCSRKVMCLECVQRAIRTTQRCPLCCHDVSGTTRVNRR